MMMLKPSLPGWMRRGGRTGDEGIAHHSYRFLRVHLMMICSSPFHGVPVLLKDNVHTCDKMNTTAGSFALLEAKPAQEASIVTRLRKAGVILLGKANMSEWANFRSTNSSDGWSARGRQTMGTYYPESSPEGSSSGSCVAVALGLTFASIGTEVCIMTRVFLKFIDGF